jgi:hypothetical protein
MFRFFRNVLDNERLSRCRVSDEDGPHSASRSVVAGIVNAPSVLFSLFCDRVVRRDVETASPANREPPPGGPGVLPERLSCMYGLNAFERMLPTDSAITTLAKSACGRTPQPAR